MHIEASPFTSLEHGKRKIDGSLIYPDNLKPKNPAILFVHGWTSNQNGYIPRAEALAEIGFVGYAFNLPGHGTSEGDINRLTRQEYFDSVIEAYDHLKDQSTVDGGRIGVVGASFGGYLAALLTKERNIKWLVLRAPANYQDEGFNTQPQIEYGYEEPKTKDWREKVLSYSETEALRALHGYLSETLIVESEKDIIVPHQSVQNYANVVSDPSKLTHTVMRGADHTIREEKYRKE